MYRLTTFGGLGLRATVNDGPDQPRSSDLPPKGFALLVLLAASPGSGISRDSLLGHLWPERESERGRNALRQALHALRRDLGVPDLVTGSFTLHLNSRLIASDLQDFEAARAAGDHRRAIAVYAGPFLDGFYLGAAPEFERWVERRRAEYADQVASMLEGLARRAAQEGDTAESVEWWRRLAALDPLSSRTALGLVEALAASGNPAGALRHAQAHEVMVRDELGAAPDPALITLANRIRAGRPAVRSSALPEVPVQQPAVPQYKISGSRGSSAERLRESLERELSDRYVLEGELESAREGPVRVVRARDRRHGRPVMLRILHPALASQLDTERFVREIRLTAKLLHPHILPLLDSGEVAGCPWYAVPSVQSETLRQRLSREGALEPDEAVRLARELADALEYAHAHGIVHRDLHPENIVLTGGHALLTNLGIARALDTATGGSLTETGVLLGSPAYVSPEQAEGAAVDGRSDQYSLGALLLEMLSGEPLFSGPTPQSILAKRTAEPTPSPVRLQGLPPPIAAVLLKALALRPEDRFPSMSELDKALAAPASALDEGTWWSRLKAKIFAPRVGG
jgi:DNA-binding SARP family transcriptional activator